MILRLAGAGSAEELGGPARQLDDVESRRGRHYRDTQAWLRCGARFQFGDSHCNRTHLLAVQPLYCVL